MNKWLISLDNLQLWAGPFDFCGGGAVEEQARWFFIFLDIAGVFFFFREVAGELFFFTPRKRVQEPDCGEKLG